MKLGILTFHSQLNYGGVLQCWALKTVLNGMGHEVVVVDRWLDKDNAALMREFATLTMKGWIKLFVRGVLGCGDFGKLLRTIRTIRFVRGLGLTKEHFCEWSEIEHSNIKAFKHLDVLIVGSDQVWHCGDWGCPRVYLLEDAPRVRAIAYAASFGMKKIPANMMELYREGVARFSRISCRESEGVDICRDLGVRATHVVDPTLLLDSSQWEKLIAERDRVGCANRPKLVCYFMSVNVAEILPELNSFASAENCDVEILADKAPPWPFPKSISNIMANFKSRHVRICRSYGPKEFVRSFASATWVATDSFHAVMFSSVFNCNARFLRPKNEMRKKMFARIEEFAAECVDGIFFVDDVEQALASFRRREGMEYDVARISAMRAKSKKWLEDALGNAG